MPGPAGSTAVSGDAPGRGASPAAPDGRGRPAATGDAGGAGEGRILFFPDMCTCAAGGEGGGCERCRIVCPARAIDFGEDGLPRIDGAACTRCGICVGVCEAFSSSLITVYDFAKRVERRAQEHGAAYLCCGEDVFEGLKPAANVFVVACLASLPPELVAYLLAKDVPLVLAHDLSYCEACPTGGAVAGRLWRRSFDLAQEWTGRGLRAADEIPEEEGLAEKMAAPDRRGLFANAVAAAGDIASGRYRASKLNTVDDFLARRDRMRASARALAAAPVFLDEASRENSRAGRRLRRRLMREAVEADPAIAARVPGLADALQQRQEETDD